MQSFSPSPAVLYPSMGRGADTAAPPEDSFREVLASRLQAAISSRDSAARGTAARTSGLPTSRPAGSRSGLGTGHAAATGSNTGAARQITASRERKAQNQGHHTNDNKPSTQSATGTGPGLTATSSPNSQGNSGTDLPQSLRDFLAFLQSLPGGTLKIPQEQVPAVSSFLVNAGLPQAEVNRLLSPSSSGESSLTAADLLAAWQQSHGQGQGLAGGSGPASVQATAPAPAPAANTQAQNSQDIRQTPDYRALWEHLTLPDSLLPTLRLALANLGATPEALAQLEQEAQGHGVPLTRVWGILQNLQNGQTVNSAGAQGGAANAQAAVIGQQKASGAEMQDWRQMLLQAGVPAQVADQLAGHTSPVTEEQLKNNLLSMAPPEQGPPVMDNPKPLYLPGNLRMRPFFWQSQTGSEQPQEQAQTQLNGDGTEAKGQNSAQDFAALATATAAAPAQTLAMPAFAAQLEGLTQAMPQPGSSTGNASTVWGPFSPDIQEPLWAQLQSGVVSNLSQGENQVTISLNPPDMGQIQLSLQLNGQDLAVTAVATRPEVAAMANQGMPQLAEALAQQGLVLTQFQVHVQGQPGSQVAPVAAGTRQKGSEPEGKLSTSSRRRAGEVNRFV